MQTPISKPGKLPIQLLDSRRRPSSSLALTAPSAFRHVSLKLLHTTIRNAVALQAVPTGSRALPDVRPRAEAKRLAGQTSVRSAEEGVELFVA